MKRRWTIAMAVTALCLGPAVANAQQAQSQPSVVEAGERPAQRGPAENFTGRVSVVPLVQPVPPGQATLGLVTFTPGARSNWHSHPAGQSLYVTDGCGWTQEQGGPVRRICKGDTVYASPGVSHWHGATDISFMSHLAISELHDGENVAWGAPVTDAEYDAGHEAR